MTPYDHTVILDTDMLFTDDVSHWWEHFVTRDITACCDISTFRNESTSIISNHSSLSMIIEPARVHLRLIFNFGVFNLT